MWQFGEFLLADLVYTEYLYAVFFRFYASPEKLFVSCDYCVLFAYLASMVLM